MKYSDRISFIGAANSVIVAAIPYFTLFFQWGEEAENRAEQLLLLLTIVALYLLSVFYGRRIRNAAWVEGFARGYFYNFIYETADLLLDNEADVQVAGRQLISANPGSGSGLATTGSYQANQVRLLIISPGGLYASYRVAELLATLFGDAEVMPGPNSGVGIRKKFLKAHEIPAQHKFLLLDCPPTTLRAIKLHRESLRGIDHNDPFESLDPRAQKGLQQIRQRGRKHLVPSFENAMTNIIGDLTRGARDHRYQDLIRIVSLDDILKEIIPAESFESLALIGDNNSRNSRNEKERVKALLKSKEAEIKARLESLVLEL